MNLIASLFAIAACAVVYAQDPTNCNGESRALKGTDFVLTDQGDSSNVVSLSRIMESNGRRVKVSDVFADGNHLMSGPSNKLAWEAKPDFNDMKTKKWVPQGITSTADAFDAGTYQGYDGWVVSWHRHDDKSVRVSFVDRKTKKYRHVLLVYPHAADDFREVPVHAGGILWYGNSLWVVDTWNGIRVFDMDNIWKVSSGDGVGKTAGGDYSAAGYRYVIPQIRWYKFTSPFSFRHSFIALDRTASPDHIIVGEYQTDTAANPTRLVQYELDYTTRKLKATDGKSAGVWAYCVNIERMQGAVSVNKAIYISRSNGGDEGDVFGWVPGGYAYNNRGFYPPSPEDLSYNKHGDLVYGLTEVSGGRYILTDKRSSLKTA